MFAFKEAHVTGVGGHCVLWASALVMSLAPRITGLAGLMALQGNLDVTAHRAFWRGIVEDVEAGLPTSGSGVLRDLVRTVRRDLGQRDNYLMGHLVALACYAGGMKVLFLECHTADTRKTHCLVTAQYFGGALPRGWEGRVGDDIVVAMIQQCAEQNDQHVRLFIPQSDVFLAKMQGCAEGQFCVLSAAIGSSLPGMHD